MKPRLGGGPSGGPHAEWKLPPDRERLRPGLGLDQGLVRGMAFAGVVAGFVVRSFAPEARDGMSLFVIEAKGWLLFLLAQYVLGWLVARRRDGVPMDTSVRRLLLSQPVDGACPVLAEVRQSGALTGADQGLAWIEGGRLVFKGVATTFYLRRDDLPPWPLWRRSQKAASSDRGELDLTWATLRITPIDPYEDHSTRRRAARFQAELLTWLKQPGGVPAAPGLWPPSSLHPHALLSRRFLVGSLLVLGAVVALDLAAILAWLPTRPDSALFGFEVIGRTGAFLAGTSMVREAIRTWNTHRVRAGLADRAE